MRPIDHALSEWRIKWIAETQSERRFGCFRTNSNSYASFQGIRCYRPVLPLRSRVDDPAKIFDHSWNNQRRSGRRMRYHGVSSVLCFHKSLPILAWDSELRDFRVSLSSSNSMARDGTNMFFRSLSMVTFCAIYILQAIARSSDSSRLSDWDLYRLAVIQELVAQLQSQADARYQSLDPTQLLAADAMARQLSLRMRQLLSSKSASEPTSIQYQPAKLDSASEAATNRGKGLVNDFSPNMSDTLAPAPSRQTFSIQDEALPFISDWDLDSLFKDFTYQDVF